MSYDFEAEMQCMECDYKFFMDLDERPKCPRCQGVKIIEVQVDEPDPEA